jgi:serine protease AprX
MRPVRCRLSRVIFGRSSKRPAPGPTAAGARQRQQERSTTLNARIDRSTAVAAASRTSLRPLAGAILTIFVAAFVLTPAGTRASSAPDVSVIVRTFSGAQARIEGLVTSEGGSITAELPIIAGFSATLPQRVADAIGADPSVVSISPDVALAPQTASYDPGTDTNSMASTTKYSGATAWWRAGYTGDGVDVALIDTGVAPVTGLDGSNKVIYGPDLSIESQSSALTNLDTYGHGTFMAGLIAGNDPTLTAPYDQSPPSAYRGMAPDARIVSLKVGTADGGTDVSQVIAAIDWVVQHANDPGMNIRVLNLSYGTNSVQPYTVDPLAYAAEVAWKQGIVVVAAGGNYGFQSHLNSLPALADPAFDPYVLAVGTSDSNGTSTLADDTVPAFSPWPKRGATRGVDMVAPGMHLQGLRVPNSYIDINHPEGQIDSRYFRGSGTSQSAAIVSGAAALVLEKYPNATPDQLKELLSDSGYPIIGKAQQIGGGELQLGSALTAPLPTYAVQRWLPSTGAGSLEAARGSDHISMDGVALTGEQDIMGSPFDAPAMAILEAQGKSWSGGIWNGKSWSGNSWSGNSWSGLSWSGISWSGLSWSGLSWSGLSWSGNSWSGLSWSGLSWSGNSWSGNSWSGLSWSGSSWLGVSLGVLPLSGLTLSGTSSSGSNTQVGAWS